MKKLLFVFASVFCLAVATNAQVGSMTATNGLKLDTVTNAVTENLFIGDGTTGKLKFNGSVSFILTVTKISGTVGGTATLQGSHNGTDWASIASAYTITDATQTKSFEVTKSYYTYYRINIVTTGTMSASYKGTYQATSNNF